MRVHGRLRVCLILGIVAFFVVISIFPFTPVSAAQITNRSLTLQAGATDGGSKPGGVVNHLFAFTIATTNNVGSIKFEYCTVAVGSCITPTGLHTTSTTYGTETGATGFTLNNTTDGSPYITRSAASISASTAVSYQLLDVTNPTTTNETFYVRITTYASNNTSGSPIDNGVVAATTATQITLTGTMPESLIFCTGSTVGTTLGIPDCSTATGGSISFNQLFSPTSASTALSQMGASTNAGTGYVISANGATLTSGSNTIAAMATAVPAGVGSAQFGLNLVANTLAASNPTVGTALTPTSNGTNLRGQARTGYDTPDTFKFVSGDNIADSAYGGAGPTDAQIFTVAYIVNVPGSQPAGTYTTTLTYICTPTF